MEPREPFAEVFAQLRAILTRHAAAFTAVHDTADNYYLNGGATAKYPDGFFFGAVQIKKRYVSYHLMAVYAEPALLADMSAALRKRMQGKSCFNFTAVDAPLFAELATLTERAVACYARRGWLAHPSAHDERS
ncbi:MAG: hypothetical protein H0X24_24715 [Ktedonobacterales bacterium]|nr:hypothetical protein [Ktedonobacterales bacterium]